MDNMKGRVAVVTGAGSGIGKALALGLAAEGANVVLADIEQTALDAAEAEVGAAGVETLGVITDVSDPDSVEALASATIERFGEVHMVCNNAGVGGGGLVRNQQLADWRWVIDVCLWGVIYGVHHFLPHLRKAEEAHIMSTASMAGLIPVVGLAPYNAAKYGVVGLMETLHLEMVRDKEANVGVSVLCPGVVRTNIATAQRNRQDHHKRAPKPNKDPVKAEADTKRRNEKIAEQLARGMEPTQVAANVIDAMYRNRFWVITHPELLAEVERRHESLVSDGNPPTGFSFADNL